MGPKVRAAIEFLERGGKEVIITSPSRMEDAVEGRSGTWIMPDSSSRRWSSQSVRAVRRPSVVSLEGASGEAKWHNKRG